MTTFNETDQQIHQAVQTLAKFNCAFVPKTPADEYTNLGFDPIGERLWGRWAQSGERRYCLTLSLREQEFQLFDDGYHIVGRWRLEGQRQAILEESVARRLTEDFGLNGQVLLRPLHYQIQTYSFSGIPFSAWETIAVEVWMKYRALANQAGQELLAYFQLDEEVRIWPHHFDTGVYFEPDNRIGIGFGFAMADPMVPEAYFYLSFYGLNGHQVAYEQLPDLKGGAWKTGAGWQGAILPFHQIKTPQVRQFVRTVLQWAGYL